MNGVDLARFEFDYDTTWHAFFLDPGLNVYSRYGGRDEEAADGRQSKESLLTTMREVLEVHERRKARAAVLPFLLRDGQGEGRDDDVHPAPAKRSIPEDIPLLKRGHQGCVHCHQVQEYRMLQDFHDKKFSREQLFGYPLPENVGLGFDRAHGHRIEAVIPDSPAAKAGLAAGDVVTRVADVAVHSEQDFRWALHRAPGGEQPMVTVVRSANGSFIDRAEAAALEKEIKNNYSDPSKDPPTHKPASK
jgi:predicted metalloprotease with PDZ domain